LIGIARISVLERKVYFMQMDKAAQLNREWGNKPCSHPNLEKEYHLGADTGDYVCSTCGESGWGRDWPEREEKEKLLICKSREILELLKSEGFDNEEIDVIIRAIASTSKK
jgi:hypothetical protein